MSSQFQSLLSPDGAPSKISAGKAGAFLFGSVPVLLLGFEGGGYGAAVSAAYGILLFWGLLVAYTFGFLQIPRPTKLGWLAIAALFGLVIWFLVALTWSNSPERGLTEVVRLLVVTGTLSVALSFSSMRNSRFMLGGALTGLAAVATAAVLSRLIPSLFDAAWQPTDFDLNRLAWPIGYWNALGALAAIGICLALPLGARSRSSWASCLCLATVPVFCMCIALTASRGAVVCALVGVALTLTLVRPRLIILRSIAIAGSACAIAIWSLIKHPEVSNAVGGSTGQAAGQSVLVVLLLVTAGVLLVQFAFRYADEMEFTPELPRLDERQRLPAIAAAIAVAIVAAVILQLPQRTSTALKEFGSPELLTQSAPDRPLQRFGSVEGNQRSQIWSGAIDAFESHPLSGIGLGSWELWWTPRRGQIVFARNVHSQPLEVLAETGLVGGLLLLALLAAPLAVALQPIRSRVQGAIVGLPAFGAFVSSIFIDWSWQSTVIPVVGFTIAAGLLSKPMSLTASPSRRSRLRLKPLSVAALALCAVAATAVFLFASVTPHAVNKSNRLLAAGDTAGAVDVLRDARATASFAITPVLLESQVRADAGDGVGARDVALLATQREPKNWRAWLALARTESSLGHSARAVKAYSKARVLNPSLALALARLPRQIKLAPKT